MAGVSDAMLAELAAVVAAVLPAVAARVPGAPAAELGRLRAAGEGDPWPTGGPAGFDRAVARLRADRERGSAESPVRDALGSLPALLTERLLGALELTVSELDLGGAPDLTGFLGESLTDSFVFVSVGGQSAAVAGATTLDQVRPAAVPLVAALARQLSVHPRVAPLLVVPPEVIDEPGVAAAHGAAYLALAVATTAAVLHGAGVEPWAAQPPAVLGVAIGIAVVLLREVPMPASYAAAVLARTREEYLLPLSSHSQVPVKGHRFALLEGPAVPEADFAGNGLVAVIPGGAVIRTGAESGQVSVVLTVLDGPPPEVADGWEEIVEVSWRAGAGGATVTGASAVGRHRRGTTPPWPGDYRLRVHARGRDDAEDLEYYELVVWQAPAAPSIVHARTDRLGHRLRGEPEPPRPSRPEAAYRWLRHSALSEAATVTVVTGASTEDVLRAFGADPNQPESIRDISEELQDRQSIDPWVAVLNAGDAVLAVEYNGWQGSNAPVLERASAAGRAASMYWNVNAVTRLSFAERGEVLLSEEPFSELEAPAPVGRALAGLDFGDVYRGKPAMGLVAVERFTGHSVTAEDLARIEAAGIGFRILPDLPILYPYHPQHGDPLGLDLDALTGLPAPDLRELAWWAAAEAARHAGADSDPDIVASIAGRALTANAHHRARRSQLHGGEHPWLWLALHRATNPDPLAAVTGAVYAARFAAGPHAANLLADAQARIATLSAE